MRTFCKAELAAKNGKVTMSTHRYYNFDLQMMKLIEFSDIFIESSIDDLTSLIKSNLMKQLNVKTEDDVINMGYFNLDNLLANNNFFVGDRGLTWTFATYEIACYSVGETVITLDYETLKPYMLENSEVIKLIQ